ncbi:ribonuclease H-like domain-containing protein [Lentinula raphanica]|nr:ribonuclease H-like domain-containing protein [Lentinula raphanica]
MGKLKGEIWQFFWKGEKANSSQYRAICLGCIRNALGDTQLDDIATSNLQNETSFQNAVDTVGSVLGEKKSMIAHILGGEKPCRFASAAATAKANELRKKIQVQSKRKQDAQPDSEPEDEVDATSPRPSKKRRAIDRVEKIQTKLKVYKGINIPFTNEEEKMIHTQFLRATISANLPFSWVDDPEVVKLFMMFRACAGDVIPARRVLGGRLLAKESERVEQELKDELKGKKVTLTCDGVKDISKKSLMGPRLVDLYYDATADKKDGDSMEKALSVMIDKVEKRYGCTVVSLGTDNDGGTKAGRVKLGTQRPWVLTFPCGAHQGHLCLADYFKVNPDAETTSQQATELIGWLNNHGRVRSIFDDIQKEQTKQVKTYLVANMTRWTTHLVAFLCLLELKQSLRTAAITKREEIISAQIEDLEPIAYVTNICQGDKARPDAVLLAFAGMYTYFQNLPSSRVSISKGMMERLERRWAGFDQHLMITALLLNPFERLDCFGPDAGVNILNLNAMVTELYNRVTSRPVSEELELDPEQIEEWDHGQLRRSQEFSAAFLHYCSSTGPFRNWDELKAEFEKIHKDNPIIFWESMKADREVAELAEFALTILHIVLNTSGNERQFSKVKIRKDRLRNRLQLTKLEQSIKIVENLREMHEIQGLKDIRAVRNNHSEDRVGQLLHIPRYSDSVQEDDNDTLQGSILVTNRRKWRAELEQWKRDAEQYDEEFGNDTGPLPLPETRRPSRSWLPRSLALLFGGSARLSGGQMEGSEHSNNGGRPRRARRGAFSEEQLLMELLAQEEEEEILDDGALEGSGDEYNGE